MYIEIIDLEMYLDQRFTTNPFCNFPVSHSCLVCTVC